MSRHIQPLAMSHIISSDAPLSSPLSDSTPWDAQLLYSPTVDTFALNYPLYTLPPSPPHSVDSTGSPLPTARVLKSRMSPESETEQQLCIPTHQVFDFPAYAPPQTPPSPPAPPRLSVSIPPPSMIPSKRAASITPVTTKKARSGERISTKDFVPPDVSGLSKREARLVKNRAAAFLSRQRKREEFENMEVRVAELEQENARLLALAQGAPRVDDHEDHDYDHEELLSEVEQLRTQLAAMQKRERELAAELLRNAAGRPVKLEAMEPQLPAPTREPLPAPHRSEKSGASIGLMVLLCALPTLLSMPTQSSLPTTFSLPFSSSSLPPSSFDMNTFLPSEFDWSSLSGAAMELDVPEGKTGSLARKLEFVDVDAEALGLGQGGLDVSFDALPSEDGKIRVRIHPPAASAAGSSMGSPAPSSQADLEDQTMFGGDFTSVSLPSDSMFAPDADPLGPFLGTGMDYSMSLPSALGSPTTATFPQASFDFDFSASRAASPGSGRRRVRIALKSLPGQGKEGGEWEVELC
ncbi:hypothetical protein CERSUDRAFT_118233 [Gelatoporia subvermispora B]|uniref:BZIP domain-containing protein n=1 Tax=Ceriporiopsis subvermispora (strain B) TaxID=914234 RepID=M2R4M7_CERS8|nr:hypothetical protein CERSUDRAFT_118233 [Gelatoporia subvermispora B]